MPERFYYPDFIARNWGFHSFRKFLKVTEPWQKLFENLDLSDARHLLLHHCADLYN
jgi:hypothetical protein